MYSLSFSLLASVKMPRNSAELKNLRSVHTLHVQDRLVGVTVDRPLLLHLVLQLKDGLLHFLHLVLRLNSSFLQGRHPVAQLLLSLLSLFLNLLACGLHLCMDTMFIKFVCLCELLQCTKCILHLKSL